MTISGCGRDGAVHLREARVQERQLQAARREVMGKWSHRLGREE